MNKIKLVTSFTILFALFGMFSCDDEPIDPAIDLNPIPVVPATASFKADFNSQTYIADQAEAAIFGGQIIVNSFKGSALEGFTITVDGIAAGSYPTNINTVSYSPGIGSTEVYQSVNPANPAADTGQITITMVDIINKTVSGNFNFTGYYQQGSTTLTKEFTNGEFLFIPYTE